MSYSGPEEERRRREREAEVEEAKKQEYTTVESERPDKQPGITESQASPHTGKDYAELKRAQEQTSRVPESTRVTKSARQAEEQSKELVEEAAKVQEQIDKYSETKMVAQTVRYPEGGGYEVTEASASEYNQRIADYVEKLKQYKTDLLKGASELSRYSSQSKEGLREWSKKTREGLDSYRDQIERYEHARTEVTAQATMNELESKKIFSDKPTYAGGLITVEKPEDPTYKAIERTIWKAGEAEVKLQQISSSLSSQARTLREEARQEAREGKDLSSAVKFVTAGFTSGLVKTAYDVASFYVRPYQWVRTAEATFKIGTDPEYAAKVGESIIMGVQEDPLGAAVSVPATFLTLNVLGITKTKVSQTTRSLVEKAGVTVVKKTPILRDIYYSKKLGLNIEPEFISKIRSSEVVQYGKLHPEFLKIKPAPKTEGLLSSAYSKVKPTIDEIRMYQRLHPDFIKGIAASPKPTKITSLFQFKQYMKIQPDYIQAKPYTPSIGIPTGITGKIFAFSQYAKLSPDYIQVKPHSTPSTGLSGLWAEFRQYGKISPDSIPVRPADSKPYSPGILDEFKQSMKTGPSYKTTSSKTYRMYWEESQSQTYSRNMQSFFESTFREPITSKPRKPILILPSTQVIEPEQKEIQRDILSTGPPSIFRGPTKSETRTLPNPFFPKRKGPLPNPYLEPIEKTVLEEKQKPTDKLKEKEKEPLKIFDETKDIPRGKDIQPEKPKQGTPQKPREILGQPQTPRIKQPQKPKQKTPQTIFPVLKHGQSQKNPFSMKAIHEQTRRKKRSLAPLIGFERRRHRIKTPEEIMGQFKPKKKRRKKLKIF